MYLFAFGAVPGYVKATGACSTGFLGGFCSGITWFPLPGAKHYFPSYLLLLGGVVLVWLLLFLFCRWFLPRLYSLRGGASPGFVAVWGTMLASVLTIWGFTLVRESSTWGKFFRIGGAVLILPLILVLEALELAVVELKDKELLTISLNFSRVPQIMKDFKEDEHAYLRAREWCLAALLVGLTTLVEFERYHVPGLGVFDGWLARTLTTVVLATVVVIWIAQAPGKEFGTTVPVGLLDRRVMVGWMHKTILLLARWAKSSRINQPSDVAAECLRKILNFSRTENPLPPGGDRFFTELIRRYGYADCHVDEEYTIQEDGSCFLRQSELAYVAKGMRVYTRIFTATEKLARKPEAHYEAFVVTIPSILTPENVDQWLQKKGLNRVCRDTELSNPSIDLQDGDKKAVITIELPKQLDDLLEKDEAFLIKVENRAWFPANAFRGCKSLSKDDNWERDLPKPCLRARTRLKMEDGTAIGWKFKKLEFFALQKQNGRNHPYQPETTRFIGMQNLTDPTQPGGISDGGRSLTIHLDYGLPGTTYKAEWSLAE